MITPEENEVLNLLGQAANKFSVLPVIHHADLREFILAVHAAQNIVLARAGLRDLGIVRLEGDERIGWDNEDKN